MAHARKTEKFKKHHIEEFRGRMFIYFCTFFLIITLLAIIYFIASKGLATFFQNRVNLFDFLFGTTWAPGRADDAGGPQFGAFPFIFGSFAVTIMAALVSAPLGIGAAIFMSEIGPSWGRRILQPVIELLVGIPSVVYGFVGLTLIVPFLRSSFDGLGFGLLAGMIVLSIMILPTITSVAYDAMKSLPINIKEASFGLGATRWQTIRRVLVPAALPELLTGVVLGMARAFGEALAVQMVIGNAQRLPNSLNDPTSTITSLLTLEMGNTVTGTVYNNALWSMALILLLMSFCFIFLIRLIGRRAKHER
ncbi:phosphate ABC transporter permease subunit PstC [Paenibacillus sp. J2TS4]|uniref:phosphate ABC transporter permease subunit PstC n=1 Tax=Paenibacillus sp. J2TS4 TaxID=2807194 RepID=UPI001B27A2B8|nr:phosphate ABC transporter permease subunit PstC [Paenibacillus sp. J2TS4]GIP33743.1 phosphate transport system permease protein [Paenibacillus sp. J2TS4]